jgi:hypothetical protein
VPRVVKNSGVPDPLSGGAGGVHHHRRPATDAAEDEHAASTEVGMDRCADRGGNITDIFHRDDRHFLRGGHKAVLAAGVDDLQGVHLLSGVHPHHHGEFLHAQLLRAGAQVASKAGDAFDKDSKAKETKNMKWSMLLLSGSATLREGVEAMLFLTGTSAGLSVKSVIIPGIVGIIVGSLLGVAVYYTGHTIKSLKWFFIVSAALLMFIAAGMVINGTLFFSYAGLFGIMFPYEMRPWSNLIVWNAMDCCNPEHEPGMGPAAGAVWVERGSDQSVGPVLWAVLGGQFAAFGVEGVAWYADRSSPDRAG